MNATTEPLDGTFFEDNACHAVRMPLAAAGSTSAPQLKPTQSSPEKPARREGRRANQPRRCRLHHGLRFVRKDA